MVIFNSYVCLPEGISFELQKRHLNLPEPPGTKFLPPSSLTHILCPLKPATDHTEKEWKGPDGHKNLRSPYGFPDVLVLALPLDAHPVDIPWRASQWR